MNARIVIVVIESVMMIAACLINLYAFLNISGIGRYQKLLSSYISVIILIIIVERTLHNLFVTAVTTHTYETLLLVTMIFTDSVFTAVKLYSLNTEIHKILRQAK